MDRKVLVLLCLTTIVATATAAKIIAQPYPWLRILDEKDTAKKLKDSDEIFQYSVTAINKIQHGIMAILKYSGNQNHYRTPASPVRKNLVLFLTAQNNDEVHILIKDFTKHETILPEFEPYPHDRNVTEKIEKPSFQLDVVKVPAFRVRVIRASTKEVLLDLGEQLIYTKWYTQVNSTLPGHRIFGLGERSSSFRLSTGVYTIFNNGYMKHEVGKAGFQLYGYHPMYLVQERSGNFHVGLFRSLAPLDVALQAERGASSIEFRLASTVVDMKFFIGNDNPETSVKKYHLYLGGWQQQAFWAFGHHQSRWGYKTLDQMKAVIKGYRDNKLPFDGKP